MSARYVICRGIVPVQAIEAGTHGAAEKMAEVMYGAGAWVWNATAMPNAFVQRAAQREQQADAAAEAAHV